MGQPLTTHRHFCTYFDHRYLARGLALHASLAAVCDDFTLWVLPLSDETEGFLDQAGLGSLQVVRMSSLESFDPELRASRANRSLVEFYFTCSPCLLRYLFAQHPDIMEVTYLDSDLYFFSSPEILFNEISGASVAISPHRFSPKAALSHAKFGRYNVGWLTFRNDANGHACLDWWRDRCLEWCFDRVEADRYADQKYLDRFEALFGGVHVIDHPGANLAPWNLARYAVECHDGKVVVDDRELVFFHFQGLRQLTEHMYDSNLTGYGTRLTELVRQHVFRPYLDALQRAEVFMQSRTLSAVSNEGIRRRGHGLAGLRYTAGRALRTLRAAAAGNLIKT